MRRRPCASYPIAVGALVVYDITKQTSFDNVEKWLAELKENATQDITMMLVGNKTDLESARVVSTEQGKAYASERGITFLEASAKTASNVEASFLQILSEIYEKKASKEQAAGSAGGGNTVSVDIKGKAAKKPCCAT
jgi:Ras-related protein Rab-11A